MYGLETYGWVRREVMRDGMSEREAARVFGLDRGTISKMVRFSAPPGYRRGSRRRRTQADAHAAFIDDILKTDQSSHGKQRHTVQRIYERLRDERGFTGGYTTVRDHVRPRRQVLQEAFVPLTHPPGHGQADFGEAVAILGGVEQKVRFFVMDLPQSDGIFVKAYLSETAEAFSDGHVAAFAFFGGVPLSILYDNTRLAMAKILGDGTRKRSHLFEQLQSHYLFDDRFGRPSKGNDKGKVEGMIGFSRRTFMVPVPRFPDIAVLNAHLLDRCLARQTSVLRGTQGASIADRLAGDRTTFMGLPATPFDACHKRGGHVSSQALVRYRNTDYSVPPAYAHWGVLVKGYVDEVEGLAMSAAGEAPEILLQHHLKTLKLATMLREYEKLARQCATENADHIRYLARLIELELLDREARMIDRRIKAACQRGVKTRFVTASAIMHEMIEAHDERRLLRLQKQLATVELLIIDELGFAPFSKTGAELLFELISQRYERGATVITSNLPFDQWTAAFGDERLTGARLARLTHHVHILEMNAPSSRLAQSRARKSIKP